MVPKAYGDHLEGDALAAIKQTLGFGPGDANERTKVGSPGDVRRDLLRRINASLATHANEIGKTARKVTQEAVDAMGLSIAHIVILVLYTSPMFEYYNAVPRAMGNPAQPGHVFYGVFKGKFAQGNDVTYLMPQPEPEPDLRLPRFSASVHVLKDGIHKLSKLQQLPPTAIYRGLNDMQVPLSADGAGHTVITDVGFGSFSTNKEMSISYARGPKKSKTSTLLVSRTPFTGGGALIEFLSQYPLEKEIVVPALTALEIKTAQRLDVHLARRAGPDGYVFDEDQVLELMAEPHLERVEPEPAEPCTEFRGVLDNLRRRHDAADEAEQQRIQQIMMLVDRSDEAEQQRLLDALRALDLDA